MEANRAISALLGVSGFKASEVSRELGRVPGWLSSVLYKSRRDCGGMTTGTVAAVARVCGYRLALIPEWESIPPDSFVIDPPSMDRPAG